MTEAPTEMESIGTYSLLNPEQKVELLRKKAQFFQTSQQLNTYLLQQNEPTNILFACMGGAFRSPQLMHDFKRSLQTKNQTNYEFADPSYIDVDNVITPYQKMLREDDKKHVLVVAYDPRHAEPAALISRLISGKLHAKFEELQPLDILAATKGDLSSLNTYLLVIESSEE